MKRYSFNFEKQQLEQFNKIMASGKRSRVIRDYILEEYHLPEDIGQLAEVPAETLVYPFLLTEKASDMLDYFVEQAHQKGFVDVNRSSIMREVLIQVLSKQGNTPQKRMLKKATFLLEKGTLDLLDQYIDFNDRLPTIEKFILEDYQPPIENLEQLKVRPKESEKYRVDMDTVAMDKLDQVVNQVNIKGVKRTAVMRDVIHQFLKKLSQQQPNEILLERQLKQTIEQYNEVAGPEKVKEVIEKYYRQH